MLQPPISNLVILHQWSMLAPLAMDGMNWNGEPVVTAGHCYPRFGSKIKTTSHNNTIDTVEVTKKNIGATNISLLLH